MPPLVHLTCTLSATLQSGSKLLMITHQGEELTPFFPFTQTDYEYFTPPGDKRHHLSEAGSRRARFNA